MSSETPNPNRVRYTESAERLENLPGWRGVVHTVIFGVDTFAGKAFDVALLIAILVSILAVMLESVQEIRIHYGTELYAVEWTLTVLFTLEYILRCICVSRPMKYMTSFYGVVDLLAILPSYLGLMIPNSHSLSVVRSIRLIRIFRVLKLRHYLTEAEHLWVAMRATYNKIIVFLVVVITLVLVLGSLMYVVEGPQYGFTNIPVSVYWAIVTITTVGYGDISPQTPLGQIIASIAMILGYSIIIVPTGVFSVEVVAAAQQNTDDSLKCPSCNAGGHRADAKFCHRCGAAIQLPQTNVASGSSTNS